MQVSDKWCERKNGTNMRLKWISLLSKLQKKRFFAFQIQYAEANDGLNNASFYFVDTVLSETTQRGALENWFEINLDK